MEEDKLKDIFNKFEPELSPDYLFMNRLRGSLESVEMIKERHQAMKRKSRRAVVIAAIAGFIVGMLFSFALPYIGDSVRALAHSYPKMDLIQGIAENYQLICWIVIAALSVYASVNVYDIAFSLMKGCNKNF
ncbi:MAG: hypothetical protein K2M88_09315 [Muribaculaceae bacterium]|nr:hypothetical protein [Muribaculaceae bacterium]